MTKRIAIVTGGIGGLGTEICKHLAAAGIIVIAADLGSREQRIIEFQQETAAFTAAISFEALDVGDFANCAALIQRVEKKHGAVDIIINAAGITRDTTLRKMEPQQWIDVLRINLDGVFNMCRNVIEGMSERGYGRIINLSSVNGQTGQFGQTNYSAAKAGMHGFTMALAREVARKGITVNSVSPGYFRTEMVSKIPDAVRNQIIAGIPIGRLGEPSEIARVVNFLASEDSSYITGANIPVNGGYFMDF